MFCEQVLGLDALPVLQPAKVGDDCQFSNSTFDSQVLNLPDDFLRGSDKADLLVHNLVVGQLSQGLERSACVEAISFCA